MNRDRMKRLRQCDKCRHEEDSTEQKCPKCGGQMIVVCFDSEGKRLDLRHASHYSKQYRRT